MWFGSGRCKSPAPTRGESLDAIPAPNPSVERKTEGGRTVLVLRSSAEPSAGSRLARWLATAAGGTRERRFALDDLGVEVFGMIDGRRRVREIVDRFADRHGLNRREAELTVAAFIRMLAQRGLVVVGVFRGE